MNENVESRIGDFVGEAKSAARGAAGKRQVVSREYTGKTTGKTKDYEAIKGMAVYVKPDGGFDLGRCIEDLEGHRDEIDNPAAVCRAAEIAHTGRAHATRKKGGLVKEDLLAIQDGIELLLSEGAALEEGSEVLTEAAVPDFSDAMNSFQRDLAEYVVRSTKAGFAKELRGKPKISEELGSHVVTYKFISGTVRFKLDVVNGKVKVHYGGTHPDVKNPRIRKSWKNPFEINLWDRKAMLDLRVQVNDLMAEIQGEQAAFLAHRDPLSAK